MKTKIKCGQGYVVRTLQANDKIYALFRYGEHFYDVLIGIQHR